METSHSTTRGPPHPRVVRATLEMVNLPLATPPDPFAPHIPNLVGRVFHVWTNHCLSKKPLKDRVVPTGASASDAATKMVAATVFEEEDVRTEEEEKTKDETRRTPAEDAESIHPRHRRLRCRRRRWAAPRIRTLDVRIRADDPRADSRSSVAGGSRAGRGDGAEDETAQTAGDAAGDGSRVHPGVRPGAKEPKDKRVVDVQVAARVAAIVADSEDGDRDDARGTRGTRRDALRNGSRCRAGAIVTRRRERERRTKVYFCVDRKRRHMALSMSVVRTCQNRLRWSPRGAQVTSKCCRADRHSSARASWWSTGMSMFANTSSRVSPLGHARSPPPPSRLARGFRVARVGALRRAFQAEGAREASRRHPRRRRGVQGCRRRARPPRAPRVRGHRAHPRGFRRLPLRPRRLRRHLGHRALLQRRRHGLLRAHRAVRHLRPLRRRRQRPPRLRHVSTPRPRPRPLRRLHVRGRPRRRRRRLLGGDLDPAPSPPPSRVSSPALRPPPPYPPPPSPNTAAGSASPSTASRKTCRWCSR